MTREQRLGGAMQPARGSHGRRGVAALVAIAVVAALVVAGGDATPTAAAREFSTAMSAGSGPYGIAAGPDGNMWFTETEGDRIGRITPAGAVTEFSDGITAGSAPADITAGPDGNVWFTEYGGNRIGRITPGGVVTEFSVGLRPEVVRGLPVGPGSITAGSDGNLWFAERNGERIGRITPTGAVTTFPAGMREGSPCGIAAGPDGNLWFTEGDGTRVGRITPAGAVTIFRGVSPYVQHDSWMSRCGIAAGPDGHVWFTEWDADRIGRVNGLGVVSEFPPTAAIGTVRLRGTGAVGVRVRCPSGAARACRGTVRVMAAFAEPERRLGVRRFVVAPGRRLEVVVRLWAVARRELRTQGLVFTRVVIVPSAHGMAGAVSREVMLGRMPRPRGVG